MARPFTLLFCSAVMSKKGFLKDFIQVLLKLKLEIFIVGIFIFLV
ncbi:hypothetical protein BHO_0900020 (plasmid) [Borrelia hermsii YBT]|nr:hypothetical protein BHO_0900020 [Borrelia hermsii YBT]